ncbi:MAG: hypothetical protein ABW277_14415 [Longimicrobiaceae bacterium]
MPSTLHRGMRLLAALRPRITLVSVLVLALPSCRDAQSAAPTLSLREQLDQALAQRAAARPPREDVAYPEFLAGFERIASVRVPLAPGAAGVAGRPDVCALTPAGDVYLATSGTSGIRLWAAGSNTLRELPIPGSPDTTTVRDLFWDSRRSALYALDSRHNEVLRYGNSGAPTGLAAVNSGQANARLIVLEDGRMVLGGVREEAPERTTLLSVHDGVGRYRASFLEMSGVMLRSKLRVTPPVLLADLGGGQFLAAEPSSPEILELSADGREVGRMHAGFDGYRPPVPLAVATVDPVRIEAWMHGWDRMVLLHASPRYVYTVFQSRQGGQPRHRVEVLDRDGARVAGGMRHDSFPTCGQGDELVLVSQGRRDEVEISRWRFRGAPGGARTLGGER